jgi:hypothetical protein
LLRAWARVPAETIFSQTTDMSRRERSGRKVAREVLIVAAYVLLGILGSIAITWLSVGRPPWQTDSFTDLPAWRTLDGFFTVTLGFLFTIYIAMLIANLLGRGMTCPRCGTRNPRDADACRTCDLPLHHVVDTVGLEDGPPERT